MAQTLLATAVIARTNTGIWTTTRTRTVPPSWLIVPGLSNGFLRFPFFCNIFLPAYPETFVTFRGLAAHWRRMKLVAAFVEVRRFRLIRCIRIIESWAPFESLGPDIRQLCQEHTPGILCCSGSAMGQRCHQ